MARGSFVDTRGVIKLLDDMSFEKTSQRAIIKRVTRKSAHSLKADVKSRVVSKGSANFPELATIRRYVKIKTSKSKSNPGVNIILDNKIDVPVSAGKGKTWWRLKAYAQLVFFGNTKTRDRPDKSGKKHGNVRGIAPRNPFTEAANSKGKQATDAMKGVLLKEIQKEFNKLKRKRG